jgi:altronate dehydratase
VRSANLCRRQSVSAANLTIGLQCGASDGYSAITANPALGAAVDRLVAAGGRAILSETPEIYGAEHLLVRRAVSPDVADTLADRLVWWEEYAARDGASLDNNPSPGNKAGGITTILEKSLGAVAKAGSTPLNAVIDYARKVTAPGLTFMDSPGYDPCSATGQIAGGAHLILFTTGRGSVFGSIPSPTIKLASNAALARNMADDIDVDCSGILDGVSVDDMGAQIFARILETASGQKTASELLGLGENEWVPWIPGATY